jgi:iron complex transport system ATP-binding protein
VLLGRIPFYSRFQFIESDRDRALADRYIGLTGIADCQDKLLNELSGGQMQLAAIARALTQEPRLLLLDEPTAHLDITHQARILDLIRRLNRELSITVLMVLHDLNLASEYSHRLMLLKGGQQMACGKPDQVLTYKIVEAVYETTVLVDKNPLTGRPHIFLVSEEKKTE